jgi:hypothetical protein
LGHTILFRGAFIRYFDVRQGNEGGDVFARLQMSADWSDSVAEKMEWQGIPESITGADLTGLLLASHMILTPADKELKQHELQLDIQEVRDFKLVTSRDEEGQVRSREIRFCVKTSDEDAPALAYQYMQKIGKHGGHMRVSYVKQDSLPLEDPAAEDAQERLSSFANGEEDRSKWFLPRGGLERQKARK